MARESGSYREGYFVTVAASEAGLLAFVTAVDARLLASSGSDADAISGTIAMNALCENAAGTEYTHKVSFTFDTGDQADALGEVTTILAALEVFINAIEANSDYTTVASVDVTANIIASN